VYVITGGIYERKKKVVLSRREVEEKELNEKLDLAWSKLAVGDVLTGTIRKLTDFGAFVNLGDSYSHSNSISTLGRRGFYKDVKDKI